MDEFHLDRWGLGYTVKSDTLNGSCWLVRLCFLLPYPSHTQTHTYAHFYGYNTLPSSNPNHLTPTLTFNQF